MVRARKTLHDLGVLRYQMLLCCACTLIQYSRGRDWNPLLGKVLAIRAQCLRLGWQ
jgi:hypothetical protein